MARKSRKGIHLPDTCKDGQLEDIQDISFNIDLSSVKDKTHEVYVNIRVKTAVDYPG